MSDAPRLLRTGHGGPYEHRWLRGVCRVCGAEESTRQGCPADVDMTTLPDAPRLGSVEEAASALRALRKTWADEKGKQHD